MTEETGLTVSGELVDLNADEIIYENDHYRVMLGTALIATMSQPLYKIINKVYGVVEMETTLLPRALMEADDYSDMIKQHTQASIGAQTLEHGLN